MQIMRGPRNMSVVIVDPLYIHVIFSFSLNPLRRLRERVKRAMSSENQRILRKWKEVLVHNGINSSAGQWGIEFTSRRYGFLSIVFFFVMPDGSSGEIFCKWCNTTKRRRSALIGREIDSGEKAEAAAAPCREKKSETGKWTSRSIERESDGFQKENNSSHFQIGAPVDRTTGHHSESRLRIEIGSIMRLFSSRGFSFHFDNWMAVNARQKVLCFSHRNNGDNRHQLWL